jgi:hypothetical protein
MTKKTFNIIAVLISAVFTASVIYFIAGIILDKNNRNSHSDDIFLNLVEQTSLAASNYTIDSYNFSDSFIRAAGDFKNYNKLTLKNDQTVIYSYPSQPVKTDTDHAKVYRQSVPNSKNIPLEIEAVIYTVRPSSIFYYARTSFILILAGTVIAFVVLIFAKPETSKSYSDFSAYESEEIPDDEDTDSEEKPQEDDNPYSLSEEEKKALFSDEIDLNKELSEEKKAENEEKPLPEKSFTILNQNDLNSSLEENLINSSGLEQDLSLLIIKITPKLSDSDTVNLKMIEYAVPGSLIFDYENGYAVIIKDTKLDQALAQAESLHSKLSSCLKETNPDIKVTMGISSRTGRTISAERLLTEASAAEQHAQEEKDSPIIAFRVSPEKYREYILNS